MKAIKQATTEESLFNVLGDWCRNGASASDHVLRVLSAFVSGGAVEALEPFVDVFLSSGNRLEMIVGLDLGGTDAVALRRLHSLQAAYHGQVLVSVWDAPQRGFYVHESTNISPRLSARQTSLWRGSDRTSRVFSWLRSVPGIPKTPRKTYRCGIPLPTQSIHLRPHF